jgi:hypothetical protein
MFSRGDVASAMCLMRSLTEFGTMSGFIASIPKSMVYFCNVNNPVKEAILNCMPFKEGILPVRYLGVPLLSKNL